MRERKKRGVWAHQCFFFSLAFLVAASIAVARPAKTSSTKSATSSTAVKRPGRQDDSLDPKPAPDLALRVGGAHKADARAHFVQGMAFEENGEMDRALEAYRKVLDVDPGQSQLAARVAALLIQQEDFPQAIDVLKDAIKVNPNNAEPYQQLAFVYWRYLKRTDQAIDYANRAIALNPQDVEGYQRLVEIELAAGEEKKPLEVRDWS